MNDQSAGMEDGHIPVAAPGRPEPLILTDAIPSTPSRAELRRARRGRGRISLTVVLTLVLLALGFGYLTLAYTGKTLRLPTWTVAEVEARVRDGAPDAWGRRFGGKPPLTAPYHAVKVTGALFHTQGGLAVDGVGRVLREDGSALPNLFAGGGAARGISGPSSWGYMAGNGLLTATTFGRLAGEAAARQVGRG